MTYARTALILIVGLTRTSDRLATAEAQDDGGRRQALDLCVVVLTRALVEDGRVCVIEVALSRVVTMDLSTLALRTLLRNSNYELAVGVDGGGEARRGAAILRFAARTGRVLVMDSARVNALLILLGVNDASRSGGLSTVTGLLGRTRLAVELRA